MQELLARAKQLTVKRATSTQLIKQGPALLFSAHLAAEADGPATATLYDGTDTKGRRLIDFTAPQSQADPRAFNPPIYFDQGIYFEAGENVSSVIIQFRPCRDLTRSKKK